MWKNVRQQCKIIKIKIAPMWNHEFELSDGCSSVWDAQGYVDYIIKRHKTMPTNPTINIYVNRIKWIINLFSCDS